MNLLKKYTIPFVGLKLGKHLFEYQIDNKFFENFNYDEFQNINVLAKVEIDKKNNFLEINFIHTGKTRVCCDLTTEEFDLPINGSMSLIVRFGEVYNNDHEELLILPFGEFEINVAQYIYETIVLSIPQKKIHPGIKDGTLKTDILTKLDEFTINRTHKEEETDPRWAKLKNLITDK